MMSDKKSKINQMRATIGVQPSELSSTVNLAIDSLTQNKLFVKREGAEVLPYDTLSLGATA